MISRTHPAGPSGIAGPIWAAVASAAWLMPTHAAPWPTFYAELLIAATLLPVAVWALRPRAAAWRLDVLTAGFVAASFVPVLQALGTKFLFPGEAALASVYLLGIAFTIILGRTAEETAPGRLVDALFASLMIAGLVSTGLALVQWLSIDTFGAFVAPMPFLDRPVANVGQPNNLATVLAWGLVAVWRSHFKGYVGAVVAVLAAALLLVGVTLTQSRAGFLQVMLIAALALAAHRKLRTSGQRAAWIGLLLWFGACYVMLDPLTRAWTEQIARPMLSTGSPRERLTLLQVDLAAIAAQPWTGWGWNQNVVAHVALAERFPMHGIVGNAHNLALDLLIWNGLPLGILMTGGLLVWCWRTAMRLTSADDLLLALAVATFTLHTMLELPHVLAYFLIPVALMVGTLNARVRTPTIARLPRSAMSAVVVAWGVLLATLFVEYGRIETEETDAALQAAWPGTPPAPPPASTVVLAGLQSGLQHLRMQPHRGMSSDELAMFRSAVTRYPRRSGLFRYAEAAAINGDAQGARWSLERLCALHPVEYCVAAARDWLLLASDRYPEMTRVTVPKPSMP